MKLPFGLPQCLRDDEWAILREVALSAATENKFKRGSKKHDALDRALAALVQIVHENERREEKRSAKNDD